MQRVWLRLSKSLPEDHLQKNKPNLEKTKIHGIHRNKNAFSKQTLDLNLSQITDPKNSAIDPEKNIKLQKKKMRIQICDLWKMIKKQNDEEMC